MPFTCVPKLWGGQAISYNLINRWGVRMKIKSSLWRFRYPEMDCAGDMRFAWDASEREARAALMRKLKVRKLPQGTELWPEDGHLLIVGP